MSTWRTFAFSAVLLGTCGLCAGLSGCGAGGGGGGAAGPGAEVKIVPPENPAPTSPPVSEEYKSLSPAGKAR
jgi:hypothetical protein